MDRVLTVGYNEQAPNKKCNDSIAAPTGCIWQDNFVRSVPSILCGILIVDAGERWSLHASGH